MEEKGINVIEGKCNQGVCDICTHVVYEIRDVVEQMQDDDMW